ncbi:MAG TPA: acyl-CoA dehydrogenase family protein, partial [Acidimicrobiales bacterium]
MRFAFTEEQLELRTAVRQVLDRECTTADLRTIVDSHDHGAGRSAERWAVLSELGAPGVLVAENHGGLGLTDVELVGVLEEAGWAGLPEPLAESSALAAPLLAAATRLAADG